MIQKTNFLSNLEKSQDINIEKSQPSLKQNIGILEYALLPLELWCLKHAFVIKNPLTTGNYYNSNLMGKWYETTKNKPSKQVLMDTELYRTTEVELRAKGVNFPSYKKVHSTLVKLQDYGFLLARKVKGEKANAYWYINPQFLLKYGEEFRKKFIASS